MYKEKSWNIVSVLAIVAMLAVSAGYGAMSRAMAGPVMATGYGDMQADAAAQDSSIFVFCGGESGSLHDNAMPDNCFMCGQSATAAYGVWLTRAEATDPLDPVAARPRPNAATGPDPSPPKPILHA